MDPTLPSLDRIDLKILTELQRNGRLTNVDLAEAVGLSTSPCLARVKRLEKAGYISGYGAHIELSKLGPTVTVFTQVTLSDHRATDFARFEASVRRIDEVVDCYLASGGYDYMLKFIVRSIDDYQDLIQKILDLNIGVKTYFSYIILKTVFAKTAMPIDKFFEQ